MAQLVQSGTLQLFNHFEDEGFMWKGEGPRNVAEPVIFPKPFLTAPHILLSPVMMDCDTSSFMRYQLSARTIKEVSFVIHFHTWSDSRFARVSIGWLAIGETVDLDEKLNLPKSAKLNLWDGV